MKILDVKSNYGGYTCRMLVEDGDQDIDALVREQVSHVSAGTIYEVNKRFITPKELIVTLSTNDRSLV